jgi:Baseplate J-like protein
VSPSDGDPQLLYLEPDDEITSVVRRLRGADVGRVVLVAPGRSRATSSVVALRLLARAAADTGRSVALVADASTRALAGEAGVAAFASVADATSPTPSPAQPMTPTRAPIHVVRGAGGARSQPPKVPPPTDGLAETMAVHLPSPVPPSGGSRRLRAGSLIPRWPWLAAALVILLALGAALLPGATVSITPATTPVGPVSIPVTIDVLGHAAGELESTKPGTATGERLEEVAASGVVTFYNFNTVAVEVPRGTHVSVGGATSFITLERIVVPRGKLTGDPIDPGERSVAVAAVVPGVEGNVAAGAIDTVDDESVRLFLRGFAEVQDRLVNNPDPTAGGLETSHPVIEQEDVDAVVAAIEADIRAQLDAALARDSDRLYAAASADEVPSIDIPDDLVGTEDQETFELSGKLTFDRAYGSRAEAEAAARSAFLALGDEVPPGTAIVADSIEVDFGPASLVGARLDVTTSVTAAAAVEIDHARVRDRIAGLTIAEAKAELEPLGEVDIDLWPPWVDRVPVLELRIEVREEVHTPTDGASPQESVN